ncbi:MAG: cytochrome c [Halobacteria archaeon]|nr:cytochrome c [Halobacteria archaeon]
MDSVKGFCSVLLAGLIVAAPATAETFDRGQALYENHCKACHDTEAHMRTGRRAASHSDIRQWVTTWSFHAGLGWSNEEVDDVTDFLNRRIYHFSDQP